MFTRFASALGICLFALVLSPVIAEEIGSSNLHMAALSGKGPVSCQQECRLDLGMCQAESRANGGSSNDCESDHRQCLVDCRRKRN